jgi:mannose-1-phosphate guanylyltransferase
VSASLKAIMLIGGLGTRLRPLTLKTPKPLLPILDQPFLAYQLDFLNRHGFHDIILCTAYKAQDFHDTLGNGSHLGVNLTYVHEDSPLGTGGAIKNAEPHVEGTTLICNGDILMNLDLRSLVEFHRDRKAAATIALTEVEDPRAFGVVELVAEGRVKRFLEKPAPGETDSHWINAGAYVFEQSVFSLIPRGVPCSVERETFPRMLSENIPLYGKSLGGYWLDVGTLEKYEQAQRDVTDGRYPHRPARKALR